MPLKLHVIVASTRPGRVGIHVGRWFYGVARAHPAWETRLVDLAEVGLPLLDEPRHPRLRQYEHAHTRAWSAIVDAADAYVFVTPEYNHGIPGALKNAIDYLYREWNNKAAGFVGYGSAGGVRAVEQLRLVMGEVQVADMRAQVALSLSTDFENYSIFKPAPRHEASVGAMLDQVISWSGALKTLRKQ
jgi:NAD(P)H-dependent FMN reductase